MLLLWREECDYICSLRESEMMMNGELLRRNRGDKDRQAANAFIRHLAAARLCVSVYMVVYG